MGKRIVYCGGCGKSLLEDDFGRGKASIVDDRPYCSDCRPAGIKAETPAPPPARVTPPPQKIATSRLPVPPPTQRRTASPAPSRQALWAGAGVGLAVLVILAVALASGGPKKPPEPPPPPPSTAAPKTAATSPSPPARPPPGREEAERVEREMRAQRERDAALRFESFLAQIRQMIQADRRLARRKEIEGMIESASKTAGERRADIEKLRAEYRKWIDEAPKRMSLLGHWKLDEGTGTSVEDSSGNGRAGRLEGGPARTAGRLGNALAFDGQDDAVVVESIEGLSPHAGPQGELTLSAWVKLDSLPTEVRQQRAPIVAKGTNPDWEYALYVGGTGLFEFVVWQPGGPNYASVVGGSVKLGQWQHVAGAVRKGQFAAIYEGGSPAGRLTAFTGTSEAGPSPFFVARRGDGQFLKGAIDDVRIYSRALSDAEVKALAEGRDP
jgi:hypothetical protein